MSSAPDETDNIVANIQKNLSRNSDAGTYGEDYYANPLTNVEYEKTTHEVNIDKLLYNIASDPASKPLVQSVQSLPFIYEGHNVITDVFTVQNLSLDSLTGLSAPEYYSEPGYLVSFRLEGNDPNMGVKVFVKGMGENSYTLADYSFEQMALHGLGMTHGEATETFFTSEGETSRDISGQPSTEYPYLIRYKHLPTGTETNYEVYKGSKDDRWFVAAFTPKLYPKFNTLFFDVYNGNPTGARMIHYLEVKRLIIMDNRVSQPNVPDYSKSVLSLNPNDLIQNLIKTGNVDPQTLLDSTAIPPPPIEQIPATAAANYTLKRKKGTMKKSDGNILFSNNQQNNGSLYSLTPEQQKNQYMRPVMDENLAIYNEIMRANTQRISRLKSYGNA